MHPLREIVRLQKKNMPIGIVSICSANRFVIEAALKRAMTLNTDVLIEATANQVNQFGGYTGMKPNQFFDYVRGIAEACDFPMHKIILGGDHLGPLVWRSKPADVAMRLAETLVYDYVIAGFTKIHLDTSMKLGDDSEESLSDEIIAERGARLALKAAEAYEERLKIEPDALHPVYIIGSEVPIPGGAQEHEEIVTVTKPEAFRKTVRLFEQAFIKKGLKQEWHQVIAVVVQPGVEFGDAQIHEYDHSKAMHLISAIDDFPNLVFEGHSTDYQTMKCLKAMVEDGIAILKVGPAMTFALREMLFALALIESELMPIYGKEVSGFRDSLEKVMREHPENWMNHYHGSDEEINFAKRYSFSDRVRYYFATETVEKSIQKLLSNLENVSIPLTLLSQYVPIQYQKIREGALKNNAHEILIDGIITELDHYYYATYPTLD